MTMQEIMAIVIGGLGLLLVTFGVGRIIEDFTNERLMKWLWIVVIGLFALFVGIGMHGFGFVVRNLPDEPKEREQRDIGPRPLSTLE